MSLYAEYRKEREGKDMLEDERGFALYEILPDGIYVEDVYVKPEFRVSGVASEYVDKLAELARSLGLARIYTSVSPKAKNCTISMKVVLAYGFNLLKSDNELIYFSKEL